jgi:hypothetical protein
MASICSVTDIDPTSAAMPDAMRPPTITAVSVGASSRENDRPIDAPRVLHAPELLQAEGELDRHDHAVNTAVITVMLSDRTPSASSW